MWRNFVFLYFSGRSKFSSGCQPNTGVVLLTSLSITYMRHSCDLFVLVCGNKFYLPGFNSFCIRLSQYVLLSFNCKVQDPFVQRTDIAIYWIEIYLVFRVIQPLNDWSQNILLFGVARRISRFLFVKFSERLLTNY